MRQFAGFGSPDETNKRFKFLLERGQTGLSVAFDMPTLMGYDPDHELSEGEVGVCGVNVSSLDDMETLFKDIDLEKISISQTINDLVYLTKNDLSGTARYTSMGGAFGALGGDLTAIINNPAASSVFLNQHAPRQSNFHLVDG